LDDAHIVQIRTLPIDLLGSSREISNREQKAEGFDHRNAADVPIRRVIVFGVARREPRWRVHRLVRAGCIIHGLADLS
jgi:hypothetical protein